MITIRVTQEQGKILMKSLTYSVIDSMTTNNRKELAEFLDLKDAVKLQLPVTEE